MLEGNFIFILHLSVSFFAQKDIKVEAFAYKSENITNVLKSFIELLCGMKWHRPGLL